MLAYLEGIIKERQNGEMIVLVGSGGQGYVGYQVKTPDHPRYETLIPGDRAEVYLYSHVREDAFDLFGFLSTYEKNLFTTLLSVSGVGPRMALSLLSHTDDANLIDMILSEDKAGLTSISGVGKKTAERMVLELKDVIQKRIDAGILRGRSLSTKGSASQPAGATAE
jgi:Holliday junction DNA helicase RuvA